MFKPDDPKEVPLRLCLYMHGMCGNMTTTLEINPMTKQVICHRAKTVGNNPSDMACRTKLEAVVKGDIEKLTEQWRMGWHRVTFYGDLKPHVIELCDRLKLQLIEEA